MKNSEIHSRMMKDEKCEKDEEQMTNYERTSKA